MQKISELCYQHLSRCIHRFIRVAATNLTQHYCCVHIVPHLSCTTTCLRKDVMILPSSGRGPVCCWQYPAARCTPALHTASAAGWRAHWEEQAWTLEPSLYLRKQRTDSCVKNTFSVTVECCNLSIIKNIPCLCYCRGWPWGPRGCCRDSERAAWFGGRCSWKRHCWESWKCWLGTSEWLML